MAKDSNSKTIRFPVTLDEKLCKLAKKFARGKLQLFGQMVEYFHRTGKDPADVSDEVLKSTLLKNHDTYIRFIRAQEEKILIPVKTEVDRMVASQVKIIDSFNGQVLKANRDQAKQIEDMGRLVQSITERLDNKESLKLKFLYILNYYSKAAASASARDRETLLQEAKQHINKL